MAAFGYHLNESEIESGPFLDKLKSTYHIK